MQQLQFQQQIRADANKQKQNTSTKSRFKDDYRAYKFCSHFQAGMCWQGQVCVYAHSYAELHPASPDMPDNVGVGVFPQGMLCSGVIYSGPALFKFALSRRNYLDAALKQGYLECWGVSMWVRREVGD